MSELIPPATVEWLLSSDEPSARWVALTRLLDRAPGDPDVMAAHQAVLADPGTLDLIGRLRDWDHPEPLGGHNSAAYTPNLLGLLADMGLTTGDHPRVDAVIESLVQFHDEEGRLASPAIIKRIGPEPVLSALLCDSHAIVEVLVRFGGAEHPAVRRALDRMGAALAQTVQGRAWPCIPSNAFRGPGRKADACPQVTQEALRAISLLDADRRPVAQGDLLEAARTVLHVWSNRGAERPYMFGHGIAFKTVKWPPFWYSALGMLDAIGRYPELWEPHGAEPEDRKTVAELAACLIAYNLDPDGRVTPHSCYRGFEGFSFGQKKTTSPFATARVLSTLRPFEGLAADIGKVDVLTLGSSKGGSGVARGPR
ncbi:MAG: hypothetical protein MUP36_03800 [Demequinaceae bacterium]|nr:hypothetical protein [Demequinaceae bacterium]